MFEENPPSEFDIFSNNNYEHMKNTTTGTGNFKITNPKNKVKFYPLIEQR